MSILAKAYRWLWSSTGGRPWTYIARDFYHNAEYFILAGIFISGFLLGRSCVLSWKAFLVIMIAYSVGYIHGHFFWGTDYIEDQGNNAYV